LPYPPNTEAVSNTGFPPSIISPLANTDYIIRPGLADDSRFNQLVLLASSDQDADELFWFANAQILGRARPSERFVWTPEPGTWNISVVDKLRRSSGIQVNVETLLE